MKKKHLLSVFLYIIFSIFPVFADNTKVFTLEECARIGIGNSFVIKKNNEAVNQYSYKLKETASALSPQIGINASTTWQRPTLFFPFPAGPGATNDIVVITQWYSAYSFAVNQLITDFGKLSTALKINRYQIVQQKITADSQVQDLLFQISQAYYNYSQCKSLKEVAESQVKLWKDQHRITEAMYKTGTVANYDLLRIKVALSQSKDNLLTANKNLDIARGNLRTLMSLPSSDIIDIKEADSLWNNKEEELLSKPLEKWNLITLDNNPAIALSRILISTSKESLNLAKLDNSPSLGFQTSYSQNTPLTFMPYWAWKNMLTLSVPIYDGGLKDAKVGEYASLLKQAELNYQDSEKNVLWSVEQAYLNLHDLYPKIQTAREQTDQAKENLRVTNVRYREGINTIVEVIDSQNTFISAQAQYYQTLCNYYTQMAALSYSTGTIKNFLLEKTGGN